MSRFRGYGGNSHRGGRGGFSRGRGRDSGDFRGRQSFDQGPPESVVELGAFSYECQGQMICNVTTTEFVPFFNAPIYLEDKSCIGKIDEIFGRVTGYCVSIHPSENMSSSSFKEGVRFFIDPAKTMPMSRFTDEENGRRGGRGRGGPRRGGVGRDGRGGGRRGFGRGRGQSFGGRGGGFTRGGGFRRPFRGRGY